MNVNNRSVFLLSKLAAANMLLPGLRQDHQHRFHAELFWHPQYCRLRRQQGRCGTVDQGHGERVDLTGYQCECAGPRLDRHEADKGCHRRSCPHCGDHGPSACWPGGGSPLTSRDLSCSWPPTPATISAVLLPRGRRLSHPVNTYFLHPARSLL